jgi:THO complex subunit 4
MHLFFKCRRAFTGGPVRTRAARGARAPKAPKKPKTAEELDKELDAFMGDAEASPATAATAGTDAAQDVDMV